MSSSVIPLFFQIAPFRHFYILSSHEMTFFCPILPTACVHCHHLLCYNCFDPHFLLSVCCHQEFTSTTERVKCIGLDCLSYNHNMCRSFSLEFIFPKARQPLVCQDLLITEASRTHSDTPHSVGLLWTSDQHGAENST